MKNILLYLMFIILMAGCTQIPEEEIEPEIQTKAGVSLTFKSTPADSPCYTYKTYKFICSQEVNPGYAAYPIEKWVMTFENRTTGVSYTIHPDAKDGQLFEFQYPTAGEYRVWMTLYSRGIQVLKQALPKTVIRDGQFTLQRYFAADFDGDGIDDIYLKTDSGYWYIDYSSNGFGSWDWIGTAYGGADAIPCPADYDGDGKADLSVFTNDGNWLIDYAQNGFGSWNWSCGGYGGRHVALCPADFDGNGKVDMAVLANDGRWLIDYAQNGFGSWNWMGEGYGGRHVVPCPADYDGDGKADMAVLANDGRWLIDYAQNGFGGWNWMGYPYGGGGFTPVPGDYDGDGKADISVVEPGHYWVIDFAEGGFGNEPRTRIKLNFPQSLLSQNYVPVPGDYDGDGKMDIAIITPERMWYIDFAKNGFGSWDKVLKYKFP